MGSKYTIKVWGQHSDWTTEYSNLMVWQGESFIAALWQLMKQRRAGYGCVTFECR